MMGADDWYRQTEWTEEGAALFEEKIARSRSQKSQQLMLQAYHLLDARPDLSLSLLDRAEACADPRYPDPRMGNFRAMAELRLGNIEKVIAAYKRSIADQQRDGAIFTSSVLDYAFVVAYFRIEDDYAEAMAHLDRYPGGSPFPNSDAQAYGAAALILDAQGDITRAKEMARKALGAIEASEGELENVTGPDGISAVNFVDRLKLIAGD